MTSLPGRAPVETPDRPAARHEAVLALDAVQQRLFVVALGLRGLRSRSGGELAVEVERLETEIDDLIKDVRASALSIRPDV